MNIGGINQKASEYMTGENQVLNLRNYCFEKPGAWRSRPGYTGFATLGSGLTIYPGSLFEYAKSTGQSYVIYDSGPTLYSLDGHQAIFSPLGPSLQLDFEVYEDNLYFANGTQFARFSGSYSVDLNLPYVTDAGGFIPNATFNTSFSPPLGLIPEYNVTTGKYIFTLALVNDRGIVGPALDVVYQGGLGYYTPGVTTVGASSGLWRVWGFTIPPGYGASYVLPYKNSGVNFSAGIYPISTGSQLLSQEGASPVPFFLTTIGGVTTYMAEFPNFFAVNPPVTSVLNRSNFLSFSLGSGLFPKYLEIYNNMMFMSGFEYVLDEEDKLQSGKSTVFHSAIGEPEIVEPEYQFPVRTNNGDYIRAMYVFQNALLIFKRKSIHQVTGASPETLSLQDVNLEYGCMNNRCIVQFEDKLWFLDEEGIAEFNGSNTYIVSYPVENSLNKCDFEDSWAFHAKKYHQVWFILRDRITATYKAFVFDYVSNEWTIYDDFYKVSAMALKGTPNQDEVMYFGQNQSLIPKFFRFGESLSTDDGFGMTLVFQTRFHKRLGDSTQELWRRLFINNNLASASLGLTLNFYPDYGSSIFLSRTMGLTMFQSRIDYGISAKSMSVEGIIKSTEPVQINGYTIVSRYLRSV